MNCTILTREKYCEEHLSEATENVKRYNKARDKESISFYNSKAWKRVRYQALVRDNHLCVHCYAQERFTPAEMVDHIIEVKDNPNLKLSLENLQSLCNPCHNRKTSSERMKRIQRKL